MSARPPRPAQLARSRLDTIEAKNRLELVLGTKSRSGDQWDIWEAVYSPVGPDGYPRRIWDKRTGVIETDVAAYWREQYDLAHILRRDWEKALGPKLRGKIHLYVGDMDNYYLNNAVYLVEEFLKNQEPALRRRGRLRRPRRALLERRPDPGQRHLAPALPPDAPAEDRREDPRFRPAGGGPEELAVLRPGT